MARGSQEARDRGSRLQSWALIAEIAGGAAVVVSVVYLAIQISDNNKLLRSQAHYNALELAQRPTAMLVENETLARVVDRCHRNPPDDVDPGEWERCVNFYLIGYNAWEYMYYQNIDGSIPEELWVGADSFYRDLLQHNEGYVRFWKERAVAFAEPFRSYVDDCFADRTVTTD